jgi:tetratricopeptide (TPR) repeat protein
MSEMTRLEELQRRVQRDPASISFAALAEEYRRLGLFQEAIRICRAGLQRHPAYLSAHVTLGRALLKVGAFDEAASELEQVLRTAPENLVAIRALAEIHRRRSEMPEAIEHYQEVIAAAAAEPEPVVPTQVAPAPARITVESFVVDIRPEPPSVAGLEAFLAAIQARRSAIFQASH